MGSSSHQSYYKESRGKEVMRLSWYQSSTNSVGCSCSCRKPSPIHCLNSMSMSVCHATEGLLSDELSGSRNDEHGGPLNKENCGQKIIIIIASHEDEMNDKYNDQLYTSNEVIQ